jgi:hypothetical protein
MTWDAYHRRDTVLHEVMTVADTRRDGILPWDEVPGTEAAFGTPADLLGALQMRWHTRLSGAIERQLNEEPWDLEQAVVHARRALAGDMPGVRAVLDAHADEPTMQRAHRKEWRLLASASGRCAMDDPQAIAIGRGIEERARAIRVDRTAPVGPPTERGQHRGSNRGWLTRLRHALAA